MSELILYIDGKPVTVSNDLELTIPKPENYVSCTTGTDQTFTLNGLFEMSRLDNLMFEYQLSKLLPRKLKKSVRKKLSKAIGYELYREAYFNELKK